MNQYAQSAKFSDQLSTMPDQMLPRLAQQYKNDAITLSLILSEKNRRDRTRGAASAQQGGQPQPKVNEAVVSELMQQLPEDVGIGQLPTPNMDRMYDGGLVSFAGGGEVERYQVGGVMGDIPGFVAGTGNTIPQAGAPEEVPILRRLYREAQEKGRQYQIEQAKARIAAGVGTSADEAILAAAASAQSAGPSPQDLAQFDAASNLYMTERANRQAQSQMGAKVPPSAAPGTTPATGGPARGPAQPQMTAPTQTAAQRYAEMQKALEPDRAAMNKGIAALSESMRTASKGELEDFDKEVAERGVAFKGREERIGKREEELTKRKTDLGNFALLEFGLGLMSEPGSFAQAVGRVGQTTVKNYSSGLKDLRAAQEKLDDARDQIEEFRRNEANMTAKERRQFKSAIGRTEIEIERLGVQAAEKMYGNKREDIKNVFTADTQERLTGMEIASKERVAGMQERGAMERATMPTGTDRTAMLLGTGDTPAARLESGLRKMQEIAADKSGMAAVKILAEANAKRMPGEPPMTMEDLLKGAREFSALMYGPKVADVAPTRARP